MATSIRIEFEKHNVEGYLKSSGETEKAVRDALSVIGRKAMMAAAKEMSRILKPNHQFRVGTTGASSEQFYVQRRDMGGATLWGVFERPRRSNYFIRHGRQPGTFPNVVAIQKWLVLKAARGGIKNPKGLHHPKTDGEIRFTKRGGPRAKGRRIGRPFKADRARAHSGTYRDAAWAIAWNMKKKGANLSHNELKPPGGSPKFDYARYVIQHRRDIIAKHLREHDAATFAVLHYLMSGKSKTEFKTGDISAFS